jgi:hypothetical protein
MRGFVFPSMWVFMIGSLRGRIDGYFGFRELTLI